MANKIAGAAHLAGLAETEPGSCALASTNALDTRTIRNTRIDAAAELRAKFFGDEMGVQAVADNLGADKDDQLGAGHGLVLMGEGVAQTRNLIKHGDPVSIKVLL